MGGSHPKGSGYLPGHAKGSEGMQLQGVTFRKVEIFTLEDEVIAWTKG